MIHLSSNNSFWCNDQQSHFSTHSGEWDEKAYGSAQQIFSLGDLADVFPAFSKTKNKVVACILAGVDRQYRQLFVSNVWQGVDELISYQDVTRHHTVFEAVYMQPTDKNYPSDVLSLPDIDRNDLASCVGLRKELNNQDFDPTDPLSYSVYDVVDNSYDFTATEAVFDANAFALKERKREAKQQINAMLKDIEENEVVVRGVADVTITSVDGEGMPVVQRFKKKVEIPSDIDSLRSIASNATNNGVTFSFADRDDGNASILFEQIKKSIAEELLKSIADFKLVRSGEYRLPWYARIDAATSVDAIQKTLNAFADIEGDGDAGWQISGGKLVFSLSQVIDQIQVFKHIPKKDENGNIVIENGIVSVVKTDITEQFLSSFPNA